MVLLIVWKFEKLAFPKLKILLPQVCYMDLLWAWETFLPQTQDLASQSMLHGSSLSLRNFPSPNLRSFFPKYVTWIFFELEKFSFPKLKILLPQVCTWIYFELEKLSFPKLKILLPQVWTWIFFELEKLSFPNLRFYFPKYTKSSLNLISISKLRVLFLQVQSNLS